MDNETPHHLRLMLDFATQSWAMKRTALRKKGLSPYERDCLRLSVEKLNTLIHRYTAQLREIEMAKLR